MASISPIAKALETNHKVWSGLVQTFQMNGAGDCILNYIQRGCELNTELRKSSITAKCLYGKQISQMNDFARPLYKIVESNGDYVVIYRAMSKEYTEDLNSGFISTSNFLLKNKFGTYYMKIFVPITTRVLIADITASVYGHLNVDDNDKVFEIILSIGTKLHYIGEKEEEYYYIATYNEEAIDQRILKVMKQELWGKERDIIAERRRQIREEEKDMDIDELLDNL